MRTWRRGYFAVAVGILACLFIPMEIGVDAAGSPALRQTVTAGCRAGKVLTTDTFQAAMREVADSWNRGDAKAAAACFSEDAIYSGPPSAGHRGRTALYDYFGGAKGREMPMRMEWHNLIFDAGRQIGVGEYTFRYRIQTHGIVIVKMQDGLIHNWREYEVESSLSWEQFVGENRF